MTTGSAPWPFSEAEWARIEELLTRKGARPAQIETFRDMIPRYVEIAKIPDPHLGLSPSYLKGEIAKSRKAIASIDYLVSRYIPDGEDSDLNLAVSLKNALPYLQEIHSFEGDFIVNSDLEAKSRLYRKVSKFKNFRRFSDEILGTCADIWCSVGGIVSYKREYREFFEAFACPIISNKSFTASHNVSCTEGMFRNHVSNYISRKKRREDPARLTARSVD